MEFPHTSAPSLHNLFYYQHLIHWNMWLCLIFISELGNFYLWMLIYLVETKNKIKSSIAVIILACIIYRWLLFKRAYLVIFKSNQNPNSSILQTIFHMRFFFSDNKVCFDFFNLVKIQNFRIVELVYFLTYWGHI